MQLEEIKQSLVDETKLRESQKEIGAILIRQFGVKKTIRELDERYVRYCLYGGKNISLDKLIVCNRKMLELCEGQTFEDTIETIFDDVKVGKGKWK